MEPREQRGLLIAATTKLWKASGVWTVPSQSGGGRYTVNVNGNCKHCTCPDFELRQLPCKHIYAVEFTIQREFSSHTETNEKGETTVTETETVTKSVKVSYKQNWPAYNAAQTQEKKLFLQLLHDLCKGVEEPEYSFGRPRLPLSDMIFSSAYKTYSTVSTRRFMTDLVEAFEKGYITKAAHYNSVINYFEMPELTPILKELIAQSSMPLRSIESAFAVDSSGFGSNRFVKWFDVKHGGEVSTHDWVKVHVCCGVKTNIVTSVEVTGRNVNDCPLLPTLLDQTAENFTMAEVSADKGYSSNANLEAIVSHNAAPFIAFKSNARGDGGNKIWNKMYHFYAFNKECFFQHYHKRSNVESTFMMIKAKFGDSLRSKTDTAQVNEALLKILCHNICCVISSIFELGIEPNFATA